MNRLEGEGLVIARYLEVNPNGSLRDIAGISNPAGTIVGVSPGFTHMMEEHWPEPEKFDPMRFAPEQARERHKYAWVPFGGGAHMCLGLHFAYMQVKVLMAQILTRYRIGIEPGYEPKWQPWPIPKPKDGLTVTFRPF